VKGFGKNISVLVKHGEKASKSFLPEQLLFYASPHPLHNSRFQIPDFKSRVAENLEFGIK
jgi:hypothetical protein